MEHDFWHRRWRKNEIGFHQQEVNPYLVEHWPELQVPAGGTVFVPLCGKSRDMVWLRQHGYGIVGVELSEVALKQFVREHRIEATHVTQGAFERWRADGYRLLGGDYFALAAADLGPLAAVYDRAALIALPPPLRRDYAAHLRALLPAGLPLLLVTVEYPQHELDGPPFAVDQAEVMELYAPAWQPRLLARHDILPDSKRFRERGVTRMHEAIYHLVSPGPQ